MSDCRSPVFTGSAKIQPFAAIPVSKIPGVQKRVAALTPLQEIEEMRKLAIELGEKVGIERGHAKGFLEGYEKGKEIGAREARKAADDQLSVEVQQFHDELGKVVENLQEQIAEWFVTSEAEMTELCMTAL